MKPAKRKQFSDKERRNIIFELSQKHGYRCWYCGIDLSDPLSGSAHIDHIIPYSKGGASTIDNLALACRFCNMRKLDHDVEQFLIWISRLRTGRFECLFLSNRTVSLPPLVEDILSKSFYN